MRTSYLLKVLFSSMVALSVAVALLASPSSMSAAQIMIDDFNNPDQGTAYFINFNDPNPFVHEDTPVAGVIGGERDYYVEVKGAASPISAAGIISDANGVLQVASFGNPGSLEVLQYDGVDTDAADALVDAADLGGVDLTGGGTNSKIRLKFNSIDAGDVSTLKMKVAVVGGAGNASMEYDVAETLTDVYVPFADLGGGAMFVSIDSLTFSFNDMAAPVPNVDFELDYIDAVPEPSILAMLGGLGAFSLLAWRWRRRRA